MNLEVGFIGLGNLGTPMAANLIESGYQVTLYNRTAAKAEDLLKLGARSARTPSEAVPARGIIVTVLKDGTAVEEVVRSSGFLAKLRGGLHISMSTMSVETTKLLAGLHQQEGSAFIDAPVFGRPEAAAAKQLWVPVSGARAAKDQALPIIKALGAQGTFDFGEANGAATTVKIAGNFLIFSAFRSLVEALNLVESNNVSPESVVSMLTQTLFPAPIYRSYGNLITTKAYASLPTDLLLKDLGLFESLAHSVGVRSPIASTVAAAIREDPLAR